MSKSSSRKRANTSQTDAPSNFSFTDIDTVFGRIDYNGSKIVTVVVTGTLWSFPALKTLETAASMTIPDIDLYLVDQDSCVRALNIQPNQITIIMHSLTSLYGSQPEFCEQQGIVAGSPATVVYYERSPMNIMRPKATSAVGFFSGQINSDQFKTLSLQAQSAAAKEVKNDASRVFRLPF